MLYSKSTHDLVQELADAELGHSKRTKKEQWLVLARSLETDGVPRLKIYGTICTLIERRMRSSTRDDEAKKSIRLNSSWLFEVLQAQGYTRTASEPKPENNSRLANREVIETLRQSIVLHALAIKKLRRTDLRLSQKNRDEFTAQYRAINKVIEWAFNAKTKIPPSAELLLVECLHSESNVAKAAKKMFELRLLAMATLNKFLTKKQAVKYERVEGISTLPILQIHGRDMALFMDYLGQQCGKCRSWHVRDTGQDTGRCDKCATVEPIRTIPHCPFCFVPYYGDTLKAVKKTGRCPEAACNMQLRLPPELA